MLIAAFIAGSFFPFTSEAVMVGLQAAGLDAILLVVYATIGNVAGSMFNYCVGRFAGAQWAVKYLHVKQEQLDRANAFVQGDNRWHISGAWLGFFAFIPFLGSAISIALGMLRVNPYLTLLSVFLGKVVRYIIIALAAGLVF